MNTYAVYHRKTIFEIDIFETDLTEAPLARRLSPGCQC